jgi:hypothetical protein
MKPSCAARRFVQAATIIATSWNLIEPIDGNGRITRAFKKLERAVWRAAGGKRPTLDGCL